MGRGREARMGGARDERLVAAGEIPGVGGGGAKVVPAGCGRVLSGAGEGGARAGAGGAAR